MMCTGPRRGACWAGGVFWGFGAKKPLCAQACDGGGGGGAPLTMPAAPMTCARWLPTCATSSTVSPCPCRCPLGLGERGADAVALSSPGHGQHGLPKQAGHAAAVCVSSGARLGLRQGARLTVAAASSVWALWCPSTRHPKVWCPHESSRHVDRTGADPNKHDFVLSAEGVPHIFV